MKKTSDLYNNISQQLVELNDLIYKNKFDEDEYRSLCGTAYHIYINLKTKCDYLDKQ